MSCCVVYLEAPRLHVSSQGELLVVRLRQIHRAEGAEHLADDVVTGVPVEAEHHEVEGGALEHNNRYEYATCTRLLTASCLAYKS